MRAVRGLVLVLTRVGGGARRPVLKSTLRLEDWDQVENALAMVCRKRLAKRRFSSKRNGRDRPRIRNTTECKGMWTSERRLGTK